jgi:hypothetical protein
MSETKKSKKEFQYQSRVIVLGEIDDENVNNFASHCERSEAISQRLNSDCFVQNVDVFI